MPSSESFTLIDGAAAHALPAHIHGERVGIAPDDVARRLDWHLRDEGLCCGDVCIPVRDRDALLSEGAIDLQVLADTLGRPLALDVEQRAAALGASAADRSSVLASLEAPDFALPDLTGQVHRLSDHRGKKVLLIAYASW